MRDVDEDLEKICKMSEMFSLLRNEIQVIYSHEISVCDIMNALYLQLDYRYLFEWGGDVWDVRIEYNEAKEILLNFDFNCLWNTVESEDKLLPNELLFKRKARIKHNNQVWVIHKYDQDPFPSNPHAHDIDNSIKLDLSNGKCYRTRQYIHTIPKKQLMMLRQKAEQVFKGELPKLNLN